MFGCFAAEVLLASGPNISCAFADGAIGHPPVIVGIGSCLKPTNEIISREIIKPDSVWALVNIPDIFANILGSDNGVAGQQPAGNNPINKNLVIVLGDGSADAVISCRSQRRWPLVC